jgi:hypothetical protein
MRRVDDKKSDYHLLPTHLWPCAHLSGATWHRLKMAGPLRAQVERAGPNMCTTGGVDL